MAFVIFKTEFLKELHDMIPLGAENKITSRELREATQLINRDLKRAIKQLRDNGAIICSSLDPNTGGYFRPRSPEEALPYVQTERKRLRSEKRTLRYAEKYIAEYEAQLKVREQK